MNTLVCSNCGISTQKSLDKYGRQLMKNQTGIYYCPKCFDKSFTENKISEKKVRKAAANLLKALGADLTDPNFIETPRRFANVLMQRFGLLNNVEKELTGFSNAVFPCDSTDMVTVRDIKAFSVCPHHILTVEYDIVVSYVPHGSAIGLSKIARMCKVLANSPKLQEDVTQEIADFMMKYVHTEDVMVVVSGRHLCMASRGVSQVNSTTITSAVRGAFDTEPSARAEMLSLVGYVK